MFVVFLFVLEGGTIKTLLEDINCLDRLRVLDKDSAGLKNWQHFAQRFGVPRDVCERLKPEAQSPTKRLMELIVQVDPKRTVKNLIEGLKMIKRWDVVYALPRIFLGNV